MRRQFLRQLLSHPTSTTYAPCLQRPARQTRYASTIKKNEKETSEDRDLTKSINPRWLSDLKTRIGKCINFGLTAEQAQEAGTILKEVATDWRELVAGSEGFLTGEGRRGLYRQGVVWGEMHGHVNNVTYVRYAESARCNWALNYANILDPAHKSDWKALLTSKDIGLILRSITVDYKFPMTYPDHITVLHKLRSRPQPSTSHIILDVIILSELHRRPAARCVEDIVVYDYKSARKASLKPFMIEKFQETWEAQEEAKRRYGERVRVLSGKVEGLERGSWGAEGAVEDMG